MSNDLLYGIYAGLSCHDVEARLRQVFQKTAVPSKFSEGRGTHVSPNVSGLHHFWSQNELQWLFGDQAFEKLLCAGMKLSLQPVLSVDEVLSWNRWLQDRKHVARRIPCIDVDPESETLTHAGKLYHCDRPIALILKCLIDADGEIRSTSDIKNTFPEEPWEERLDLTIKRKLKTHSSGVGELIESVSKRGYRLRTEMCE